MTQLPPDARHLTAEQLIANAAAAYDANILIAQHAQEHPYSAMVHGGHVCALGASIPEEHREFENHMTTSLFVRRPIDNPDVYGQLMNLHDTWFKRANRGDLKGAAAAEAEFKSFIGR